MIVNLGFFVAGFLFTFALLWGLILLSGPIRFGPPKP